MERIIAEKDLFVVCTPSTCSLLLLFCLSPNLCMSLFADVVGASYYDSSLRWFENDGMGIFTEHLISDAVDEGQGVTLADLDK